MFIQDFRTDSLDVDASQLLIGIGLDFMGEYEAANSVFDYLAVNDVPESKQGDVQILRRRMIEQVNQYGKNSLLNLLSYFSSREVLPVKSSSRTRIYNTAKCLDDLLAVHSIDDVYKECMRINVRWRVLEYPWLFSKTKRFKKYFKRHILREFGFSADGVRRNILTDGVIEELRSDFSCRVKNCFCTGKFDPASGTPTPFLIHGFNQYYGKLEQDKDGYRLYSILNAHGLFEEVKGKDNDSGEMRIDFSSIVAPNDEKSINFIAICSKINLASKLLFSHKNEVYSDIFTYHRDCLIKNKQSEFSKIMQNHKQYSFVFEQGDSIFSCVSEVTLNNKKNGRQRICDVFEQVIQKGMNLEQVYDLYEQVLDVTNTLSLKDGVRLFRSNGNATRNVLNNSEMFKTLLDGYVAMSNFLDYLQSDSNRFSITVNSFPTDIFRDERYLYRINSFEQYLDCINDIRPLVNEVNYSSERSMNLIDDCFYSNDSVFRILSTHKVLKNNVILAELANSPLSFLHTAVDTIKTNNDSKHLFHLAQSTKIAWSNKDIDSFIASFQSYTLLKAESGLVQIMLAMKHSSFKWDSIDGFYYIVCFSHLLRHVMKLENHSITNEYGDYILTEPTLVAEFESYCETLDFASEEIISDNFVLRIITIQDSIACLWGKVSTTECPVTWDELRDFWYICDLLCFYYRRAYKFLTKLDAREEHSFLTYCWAAKDIEFVNLPSYISSLDEISFLMGSKLNVYQSSLIRSFDYAVQLTTERDRRTITAVNKFFSFQPNVLEILHGLSDRIDKFIPTNEKHNYVDFRLEEILANARQSLIHTIEKSQLEQARLISMKLSALVDFDSLGYAIYKGKRISTNNNRYYYHNSGFIVEISSLYSFLGATLMTEEHLSMIALMTGGY